MCSSRPRQRFSTPAWYNYQNKFKYFFKTKVASVTFRTMSLSCHLSDNESRLGNYAAKQTSKKL